MTIDFRSDTVTRPTPGMLKAMLEARVGDDVFGEDPSINELEAKGARLFGMEAGLFCPSGTMTNQIAIKCHTQPGDEVICDKNSHIYRYEGGGIAFNSGCSVQLLEGNLGRLSAEQVADAINAEDVHKPRTRLVSLENTSNRGGGSCYDWGEFEKIRDLCRDRGLSLHLDGARLFNAIIARGERSDLYGKLFDSISVCLSKGLGAPVGSLLLGSATFISRARRIRKVFGGGMRQAGYLAAAGIFALDHQVRRLEEDHLHAQKISHSLSKKDFIEDILPVETNIIIFQIRQPKDAKWFAQEMKQKNILVYAISKNQVRMVLHLDVLPEMVDKTIESIEAL